MDDDFEFREIWPVVCSCGASYDEVVWETLRYVGIQKTFGGLGAPEMELRNCAKCDSTLAQPVPDDFIDDPH